MTKVLVFWVSIFAFSLFVQPIFAGGGLISFSVSPDDAILTPGGQYIVRPTVYTDNSYTNLCKQCLIKIKFEDPKAGDIINQSSDKTDDKGTMYAKVISQTVGQKVIFAEVAMPEGYSYKSSNFILNYLPVTSEVPALVNTSKILSTPLLVQVVDQKPYQDAKGNARQVTINWNSLDEGVRYTVNIRPSDSAQWGIPGDAEGISETSAKFLISSDFDYYVRVDALKDGNSTSSKETLIAKNTESKPGEKPLSGTEELSQKIENLEQRLAQTQQKQNILEEKVNQIVSWLKSIFPFFR